MWKAVIIISMLIVCCCCLNDDVIEESRAKRRRNSTRLWGTLLMLVFTKVAVLKVISGFLVMMLLQKFISIITVLVNLYLKGPRPQPVYGAPEDYNTVGYSYGPPQELDAQKLTSFPGLSGSFNWLYNKL